MVKGKKRIYPLGSGEMVRVVDYFLTAGDELLEMMGVDKAKLPSREEWLKRLENDLNPDISQRIKYYIGWEFDGELIGHSNISDIDFGESAHAHMHIWDRKKREKGLGTWFFKNSINHYFETFRLKKIICEPCADNPAPNMVLQRLGLEPVKRYETIPGWINFKQVVVRYEITSPLEG